MLVRGNPRYPFIKMRLAWLAVALCCLFFSVCESRIPLKADREGRQRKPTPGCKLGGEFYELEEKWSPELEPVGVMFCVKCQCLPVMKKGILNRHGKVECRNMKNQCPEPLCDDPRLLPGRCCKSCPGDGEDIEDIYKKKVLTESDKEDTVQGDVRQKSKTSEYTALLVGKNVKKGVSTRGVAWARFSVDRTSLRFSVSYSRFEQPRYIRFLDADGTILHEQKIHPRSDGKKAVCGVWPRLASVYREILYKGQLTVSITTAQHQHGEVAGRITTQDTAKDETFFSLLSPSRRDGTGGAVMMTYDHSASAMKYRVHFDDLLEVNDFAPQVLVSITKGKKLLNRLSIDVSMGKSDVTGVWRPVTRGQAKQLARGKLVFRVMSQSGKLIKGIIMPRQSCGTYQAVLSGSLSLQSAKTSAAGAAIFSINERGRISYQVRLAGLSSKVIRIRLEGAPNRRGKRRRLVDLTSHFIQDMAGFGGWANGTHKKPKALDIDMLVNGHAYVNVATESYKKSELRGHVSELRFREFTKRPGDFPVILVPKSLRPDIISGTAGNAWFGFDASCVLHYEIVLEGITVNKGSTIAAQLSVPPLGGEIPVLSNRHSIKTFGGFNGNMAVGEVRKISEDLYSYLDQGRAIIQVASMTQPLGELRGNVTVENKCWRLFGDHDNNMLVDEQENLLEKVDKFTCEYEGHYHDDGESWVPDVESTCNTCSCKRGKVRCHKEVCPVLNCPNPERVPGQCCASCPVVDISASALNKNESCYFNGDKRWHPVGASWHPYIPPFGYVTCALCNCVADGQVVCDKITCPKLNCPDSVAVRRSEMDCCKVCPTELQTEGSSTFAPIDNVQGDRAVGAVCRFAGEEYDNGASWHPRVSPFGTMKCITCRCSGGKSKCKRRKCPKLNCPKRKQVPGNCCPRCATGPKQRRKINSQHLRTLDVQSDSQ